MVDEQTNNSGFIFGLFVLIIIFYIVTISLSVVSLKNVDKLKQALMNVLILGVLVIGVILSVIILVKNGPVGIIAITGIGFIVSIITAIISGITLSTAKPGHGRTEDGWILALSLLLFIAILGLYLYDIGNITALWIASIITLIIGAISYSIKLSNSSDTVSYIFLTTSLWILSIVSIIGLIFYKKNYNKNNIELLDKINNDKKYK